MRRVKETFEMPILDELKERARTALAETRDILREMKDLAVDIRREAAHSRRLGRWTR